MFFRRTVEDDRHARLLHSLKLGEFVKQHAHNETEKLEDGDGLNNWMRYFGVAPEDDEE